MPATLGNCITRTRALLDEAAATFFTDAQIVEWLNDGMRDLARRTESLLHLVTIETVAGTKVYTIPTAVAIGRVHRVVWSNAAGNQYPLIAATQQELDPIWGRDQLRAASAPMYYCLQGHPGGTGNSEYKIQVFPVPNVVGTITITAYKLPARFSTGQTADNVDVLEGWDDLLVYFAFYNGLIKDRNPAWRDIKQVYEEKVQQMMDVSRHYHDQSQFIANGHGSWVPSWLYEFEG